MSHVRYGTYSSLFDVSNNFSQALGLYSGSLKIHTFLRCFPRIKIPHHASVFPWIGLNIITPQLSQIFWYEQQYLCFWPPRSTEIYESQKIIVFLYLHFCFCFTPPICLFDFYLFFHGYILVLFLYTTHSAPPLMAATDIPLHYREAGEIVFSVFFFYIPELSC